MLSSCVSSSYTKFTERYEIVCMKHHCRRFFSLSSCTWITSHHTSFICILVKSTGNLKRCQLHAYIYLWDEMWFLWKEKIFLPAGCAALEIQEIGYIIVNICGSYSWLSSYYALRSDSYVIIVNENFFCLLPTVSDVKPLQNVADLNEWV